MDKKTVKTVRKVGIAVVILAVALYFIPIITALFILCGLIDVMRNDRKNGQLFSLYFAGNGMFTWLLAPFNLFIDLLSYKNRGVWKLEQFPDDYRREVEEVLGVFKAKQSEIIADIDANFESGRRGMYVYQWYGKQHIDNVPEFTREFKYIRTIAVSVFSGRELNLVPLRAAAADASRALQSAAGKDRQDFHRMRRRQAALVREPAVHFRRYAIASLGERT